MQSLRPKQCDKENHGSWASDDVLQLLQASRNLEFITNAFTDCQLMKDAQIIFYKAWATHCD